MSKIIVLLAAFALAIQVQAQVRPNPALTPGWTRPLSQDKVCMIKWGKDARHVTKQMKEKVCKDYGLTEAYCFGTHPNPKTGKPEQNVEFDHLVPRSEAGADDTRNLWAQEIEEAHLKDLVEDWVHKQVCAKPKHLMDLKYAQKQWEDDWFVLYKLYDPSGEKFKNLSGHSGEIKARTN
jgi:hypothetical protein